MDKIVKKAYRYKVNIDICIFMVSSLLCAKIFKSDNLQSV